MTSPELRFSVGEPVAPRDVPAPDATPIRGRTVTLRHLDADADASALFVALSTPGGDPNQFRYLPYGPFASEEDVRDFLAPRADQHDPWWYTIVDNATGQPIGLATYLRIDTDNRVIEIGHLNFGHAMQRSTAATETIYLLIAHAFDRGYRRVEWKCDNLNERSKRAAIRFGFTPEGIFRKHVIVKGRNRDTAWFAIIDDEWPAIRDAYRRWLDPANFDEQGQQRQRLRMPGP